MTALNILHPRDHSSLQNVPPDVQIYNTAKPPLFPNGRELKDDIVDILGPDIIKDDPPFPSENDVAFSERFPYLGTAHGAASPQPQVGIISGPQKPYNIYNAPLTVFDLSQLIGMSTERRARVRYWIMSPQGIIAEHVHDKRPAIVYLLEGEVMETKLDIDSKIKVAKMKAGEVVFENSGIRHWWVNQTRKMVKMVAIDVITPLEDAINEIPRVPRSPNDPFKPPVNPNAVKTETFGEHNFAEQFPDNPEVSKYRMRASRITLLPGQKSPLQNSKERPVITYILEGDALEHRSDQGMLIRRAGDFTYAKGETDYYWENPGSEQAVLFVVEFIKVP